MKKHLIIIFLLFLVINVNSQNYQELIKDGNKWNVLCEMLATCNCGFAKTYSLTLVNDTLIGELNYKKLMCETIDVENTSTVYAAAIREDTANKKVYVRYPDKDEELLYDFDPNIGDTIFVRDITNDEKVIRFVKDVGDNTMNGYDGKQVTVSDTTYIIGYNRPNNSYYTTKDESFSDVWYEGIGSLKSLIELGHIDTFAESIDNLELLCFWNYDNLIYHNYRPECVYAYVFAGIEEISNDQKINIYPNPTKGELTIDSDLGISNIQIYDVKGNAIIETKQKSINISGLSKGMYLVKVHTISNEVKRYKIIKE
jgi:hypothetical protein